MALSNHTSRIYLDEDDVWGVINVLNKRIKETPQDSLNLLYTGALIAFNLIYTQTRIDNQEVFMRLFDVQLYENDLLDSLEVTDNA